MIGDIVVLQASSTSAGTGSLRLRTQASTTVINPGEPVTMVAGASVVIAGATNLITIASPYFPNSVTGTSLVGIAETTSTQTLTLAGNVEVLLASPYTVYLITANSTTLWNTQAKYDALVGSRCLIDLTAGKYTMLATDSAQNGCIIRPLDVFAYPGKVAFSFMRETYAF